MRISPIGKPYGSVTGLLEVLRNCAKALVENIGLASRRRIASIAGIGNKICLVYRTVQRGKKRGQSRFRPVGLSHYFLEQNSRFGQAVEIWRGSASVPIAAQVPGRQ